MQTLFTHVAKIGPDYIVCDPTVPCPPTPPPTPTPTVIRQPASFGGAGPWAPDEAACLVEVRVYANEMGIAVTAPGMTMSVSAKAANTNVSAKTVTVIVREED